MLESLTAASVFLTVCPNSDGRPGGCLGFDQERTVATVDDPVLSGIGSPVAVRRFVPHLFFGRDSARILDRANNIEVICGHSLDRP